MEKELMFPLPRNKETTTTIVNVTKESWEEILTKNELALFYFWAEWAEPCRTFSPIFTNGSERHPDVVFAKIDIEKEFEITTCYQIQSLPTVIAFRQEIMLLQHTGGLQDEQIDELIEKMKAVNMNDVRRKLAEALQQE